MQSREASNLLLARQRMVPRAIRTNCSRERPVLRDGQSKRARPSRRFSIALGLASVLDLETDEPRQQRRRKELADHRFEAGEIARQRMQRGNVAKADSGECRKAEIEQRR